MPTSYAPASNASFALTGGKLPFQRDRLGRKPLAASPDSRVIQVCRLERATPGPVFRK